MDEEKLVEWLRQFDFSELSPLKQSLRQEMLAQYRRGKKSLWQKTLSADELDYVSAAGNPQIQEYKPRENR
ncbi:hypothetical protein SAMN05216582_1121 [Selenomonas ruminantium]|uniref:Uncharacterized protein n=1 Tax=Selenomonas ruminantium TaxID=971 RepID=A0A1M6UDG6_SELRU|nr:hypothetical protein [Selenomonas ruminantium]SHK67213.1 hypothetical protein SAMN05216582_1121 [Selenomonas ruminantium]